MLNSPQIDAPGSLTASDAATAGNLNGTYFYAVTFVSPLGETNFGPLTGPLVLANSQATLTAIPVSTDLTVTARNLYRTTGAPANNDYVYFLAQIADNSTTTFTDNVADANLGSASAPSVNQTGAISLGSTQAFAYGAGALGSLLLGPDALANNTGASNVAIGDRALASNTLGRFNLALGYQALFSNTTGENNFALGAQSLYMNTTGVVNIAIGSDAMYANTTGDHNTVVGIDGLRYNTTGRFNAGLSYDALHMNTTGGAGTAVGYQALYGNTTGNGNTALGFQAGVHSTTGSNNIYIGSNADTSDGTISNSIGIGLNVTLASPNQIVIGNSSHVSSQIYGYLDAPQGLKGAGTTTNDNAAAGYIGEYVSSEIAPGSGVSLTSGAAVNITSISLTAGDWDVWGNVLFRPSASAAIVSLTGFISTNGTTYPGSANAGAVGRMVFPASFVPNDDIIIVAGTKRISIASTTTVYLESVQYYSGGSMTGAGFIGARRVR